jgi:DNA-directed RNA polymerase beta subunit
MSFWFWMNSASLISNIKSGEYNWDNLLTSSKIEESILEYIDPEEQSWSMVATKPLDLIKDDNKLIKFTHCEIHPSMMLGVCASSIPYSANSQSPRNCYQCIEENEPPLLAMRRECFEECGCFIENWSMGRLKFSNPQRLNARNNF